MLRKRDGFVSLGDVAEAVALPGDRALTHRDGGPRRCCMNTLCRWGGVAPTSLDPPQEPHYGNEVEGSSHV